MFGDELNIKKLDLLCKLGSLIYLIRWIFFLLVKWLILFTKVQQNWLVLFVYKRNYLFMCILHFFFNKNYFTVSWTSFFKTKICFSKLYIISKDHPILMRRCKQIHFKWISVTKFVMLTSYDTFYLPLIHCWLFIVRKDIIASISHHPMLKFPIFPQKPCYMFFISCKYTCKFWCRIYSTPHDDIGGNQILFSIIIWKLI